MLCPVPVVFRYSAYRKQLVEGIHTVRFIDSKPVLDTERMS